MQEPEHNLAPMDNILSVEERSAEPLSPHRTSAWREKLQAKLRPIYEKHKMFLYLVLLPTFLAGVYLYGIAAPQYVSEAHFVVHGHGTGGSGPLSMSSLVEGGSGSNENTYVVEDYIESRDAMERLRQNSDLQKIYNRPEADFFARYPAFFDAKDSEHLLRYYKRHVKAETDSETGVSTLRVRTFRPEDSQKLAEALLKSSEELVNRMNVRQKLNMTRSAREEVDALEKQLADVDMQLAYYRTHVAMLNPEKESAPMLKSVASLKELLLTSRMQLAQLISTAPKSPMIPVYKQHIAVLEREITQDGGMIAGGDISLVPKIKGYDELVTQQKLLFHMLTAATTALESAKAQANRQMVYVDVVVQPNYPDWAAYPASFIMLILIFSSLFVLYVMIKLLIMGAREHSLR